MRRRRRSAGRFRVMVLTVVGVVQVPGVAGLAHFTGSWLIPLLFAALVSAPFLYGLRSPWDDLPKGRLYRWVGLWPFFAWWTACLAFAVLAPVSWAAAKIANLPSDPMLGVGGALSLLAGMYATLRSPRITHIDVEVEGLPAALDGYRIAQLSDVHCG